MNDLNLQIDITSKTFLTPYKKDSLGLRTLTVLSEMRIYAHAVIVNTVFKTKIHFLTVLTSSFSLFNVISMS